MAKREYEDRDGEKNIVKELFGWVLYLLVVVGLTYLILTYVGQRTRVSGHSMETTLSSGDNLIVDKLSYRFKDPRRFDIIVFPYKYEDNTYYIKRIIGSSSGRTRTEKSGAPRWQNGDGKVEKLQTMGAPSATAMHAQVWPEVRDDVELYLMARIQDRVDWILARYR